MGIDVKLEMGQEGVVFEVPLLPVSINKLYGIHVINGRPRVFLGHEGRRFKEQAKMFMPAKKGWPNQQSMLSLKAELHGPWFYKNGKIKKADIMNLDKVLCDAISEKYGFDDSWIWKRTIEKVESRNVKIVVKIETLAS